MDARASGTRRRNAPEFYGLPTLVPTLTQAVFAAIKYAVFRCLLG
jgi:hypothetical protein